MLTEKQVKSLAVTGKDYLVSDDTGERTGWRLQLRVRYNGTKEWRVRIRREGKSTYQSLGKYPDVSLSEARKQAREAAEGRATAAHEPTPAPVPNEPPATLYGTLGELCDAYVRDLEMRGKKSYLEAEKRLHSYVKRPFPSLWKKEARQVTPMDVRQILAHHIQRGVKVQMNRLRSWLHAAYQFGLTAEHDPRITREQRWGLLHNPAASVPKQVDWEVQGEGLLTPDDIRAAWFDLPNFRKRNQQSVLLVQLCIALGGQRIVTVLGLRKQYVHLNRELLDIPAANMKAGKPHIVPLGSNAIMILNKLIEKADERGCDLLFPKRTNLQEPMLDTSASSMLSEFRKEYNTLNLSLEDVRRTAKTVLGELGVDQRTRDRLHGHAMHDVSSRHYDRYDYLREKREAMRVWDDWLTSVLEGGDSRGHIADLSA